MLDPTRIDERLAPRARIETGDDRHIEEMLFLEERGRRYFAVRYLPGPGTAPRPVGIVQCHSFGFEQVSFRGLETAFARWAVRHGYPVLYVQGQGYGDSDGQFEDVRVATHVRDVGVALDRAPELLGMGSQVVAGVRLGALAGVVAAVGRPDVAALVLWHPVGDPKAYLTRMFRARAASLVVAGLAPGNRPGFRELLERDGFVDVLGYPILRDLFEEAKVLPLDEAIRATPPAALVIEVAKGAPDREMAGLEAALRSAGTDVTHVRIPPSRVEFAPAVPLTVSPETLAPMFKKVIEVTAEWLRAPSL